LDEALFLDPVARAAFQALAAHADFHEALEATSGPERALLERLAVQEPMAIDEPETARPRLMVVTVEPVAKRLLVAMMRTDDDRASEVKRQLDALAHARETGDWGDAQAAAERLVEWVVHEAGGSEPALPDGKAQQPVEQQV